VLVFIQRQRWCVSDKAKIALALLKPLVLLSQSVAAFVEKNHIFEKTHFFSIRRLRWV